MLPVEPVFESFTIARTNPGPNLLYLLIHDGQTSSWHARSVDITVTCHIRCADKFFILFQGVVQFGSGDGAVGIKYQILIVRTFRASDPLGTQILILWLINFVVRVV